MHIDLSHDFLLVPINAIPARKVFTPFFKLRSKYLEANQPVVHRFLKELSKHHTITGALTKNEIKKLLVKNHDKKFEDIRPVDHKKRLHTFSFYSYAETRNSLSVNGVSKMSPYIRFGLLSIRELYCAAAKQKAQVYISELAWREFRNHIFYNFPQSRELEFQEKKRGISWDNNLSYFEARKNGMT